MGGDDAPQVIVEGAVRAHRAGLPVVLVGDSARIEPLLPAGGPDVVHTEGVVSMDASAAKAVRRAPDASVRVALQLVRDGACGAAVSCGHTGATLVGAVLDLGVLPGADRPAICSVLPRSDGGRLVLLDAGANVDCKPELLASFALIGSAYAEAMGVLAPRVGLLSNGEEDQKGNAQVRATLPLLRALPLHVVGPVEPSAAMAGACDVLVCDGFVGNVLIKAAEGAVHTVVTLLREEILSRPSGRVGAWLLRGAFERFRRRVAWDAQGGALLLGTGGLVVVGHGRSNPEAVMGAIRLAHRASAAGLLDGVSRRLALRA
jgi:glycerol-3-phosphate acyltransferase PlsX